MAKQRDNAARALAQMPEVDMPAQSYNWNFRVAAVASVPDQPTEPDAIDPSIRPSLAGNNLFSTGRLAPVELPPQTYQWNLRVKAADPEILPWPTPPAVPTGVDTSPATGGRRWFRRR